MKLEERCSMCRTLYYTMFERITRKIRHASSMFTLFSLELNSGSFLLNSSPLSRDKVCECLLISLQFSATRNFTFKSERIILGIFTIGKSRDLQPSGVCHTEKWTFLLWRLVRISTFLPLLNRMHFSYTAWVESLNNRDVGEGKKHIDPVKNMSLCYCLTFILLVAIC